MIGENQMFTNGMRIVLAPLIPTATRIYYARKPRHRFKKKFQKTIRRGFYCAVKDGEFLKAGNTILVNAKTYDQLRREIQEKEKREKPWTI